MRQQSDTITFALDYNLREDTRAIISARDIVEPDNKNHQYYCTDCFNIGRHVRLKYMPETDRQMLFAQWNKATEEVLRADIFADFRAGARFERWPNAEEHKCENPVRWSEFRAFAYRQNAVSIGPYKHIFNVVLPGRRWHSEEEARQGDLRNPVRPVGLDLGGITGPAFFIRLADFVKKDPGLASFQYYNDGLGPRLFDEFYFDNPAKLHGYLSAREAFGRANSVVATYQMNPNTHPKARAHEDARQGLIDREIITGQDGNRIKLFARGTNAESGMTLFQTAARHGLGNPAKMLVLGEAYIPPERPSHVDVEIFSAGQVCAWDNPYGFFPEQKARGVHSADLQARQKTLAL